MARPDAGFRWRPAHGLIAVAGLGLAWATIANGVAGVARYAAPELALRFRPDDARARQNLIDKRLAQAPEAPVAPLVTEAMRVLRRDATAVKAVRLLALDAAQKGQTVRSDRLIDYAAALTRRDLPTQLLLIERHVARGDADGALRQFDVALRTTYAAAETLYPVLDGAIADPALEGPFVRLLRRDPPWTTSFFATAAPASAWPQRYARLLMQAPGSRTASNGDVQRLLLGAMVARGHYAPAIGYQRYLWRRQGVDAAAARDAGFTARREGPFEWSYADESDQGAERLADIGEGSGIAYRASAGGGGAVVTRLLVLPPGTHRFVFRSQDAGNAAVRPEWTLTCQPRGAVVMRAPVPRSGARVVQREVGFTVPAGCAALRLALTVSGADEPEGVEGRILSAGVE